jgi:hypothetical protein
VHLVHCDNQFVAAFFAIADADKCVEKLAEGMQPLDNNQWRYSAYHANATRWKTFVSGGNIVVVTIIYIDHNATTNVWQDETGATIITVLTDWHREQQLQVCRKCGEAGHIGKTGVCWMCEETEE